MELTNKNYVLYGNVNVHFVISWKLTLFLFFLLNGINLLNKSQISFQRTYFKLQGLTVFQNTIT